jgi:serine/threonine protein kinase
VSNITEQSGEEKVDVLVGTRLGDYEIRGLIGRGGMARVYEGYDEKLDRRAAIKVIDTHHGRDDEMTQRFFREARAIGRLDHPNIVGVYQFGESNELYYLAMKLIEGKTLLHVLKNLRKRKKYLEPEQIVKIMEQLSSALDYAHSQGIIHRDIKPSNIMLSDDDRAILMDFGLTMQADSESTLGTAFGTPRYIAPEQAISSHRAVSQSDIYSLGVVLYEMITGQAPFDNDSPMSLALSHITNPPPPPRSVRADLPELVENVVLKALEKRPENRWQTATAMVEALKKSYQGIDPGIILTNEEYDPPTILQPMTDLAVQGDTTNILQIVPKQAIVPRKTRSRAWWVVIALALVSIATFLAAVTTALNVPTVNAANAFPTEIPSTRLRLIYSATSLSIYNASGKTVSLEGLFFTRGDSSKRFEMIRFDDVDEQGYKRFAAGQCLRIEAGDGSVMPHICGPQNAPLLLKSANDIFWTSPSEADPVNTFLVKFGNTTLQTCAISLNTCEFVLP